MDKFAKAISEATSTGHKLIELIPHKLLKKEQGFYRNHCKSKKNKQQKLNQIYSLLSSLHQHILSKTPCGKGCDHCCYINVSVSELEAYIISKEVGIPIDNSLPPFKENFHGEACPFLDNGNCAIYDIRPYFCRRHLSIMPTSEWCQTDISLDQEVPLISFSSLDKSYLSLFCENQFKDIRQWFRKI